QDELGFKWAFQEDRTTNDPNKANAVLKWGFTWETKGLPTSRGGINLPLFKQDGSFTSLAGEQGEVNFPHPYASPPNIELTHPGGGTAAQSVTTVVECKPTGFKWKNGSDPKGIDRRTGPVKWTAKGVKATTIPK